MKKKDNANDKMNKWLKADNLISKEKINKGTCFDCGESMVTEEDELFCPIKNKIVKDEDNCEECNC